MRHLRILAAAGVALLAGCDLAVGIYFATRTKESRTPAAVLPSVDIVATDGAASEPGANTGEFTITRTGSTAAALDVFFVVSGTATEGTDYAAIGAQATILAGQPSVTVTITPLDNLTAEVLETVIVTITATANYTVVAPGNATVTIDDDDDNRYHVWVANLATPGDATTQETDMAGNGGNPNLGVWTEVAPAVGTLLATAEFVPPAGMNTILIQANVIQAYDIDSIEIMDAAGNVVEWAAPAAVVYRARMTSEGNLRGAPDGVVATTAATAGNKSVVFTQFTANFARFRVNLWQPGSLASGDLVWTRTLTRGSDQSAGGAAVSSAGTTYASFHDDATKDVQLVRYDSAGVASAITTVATSITAVEGSHSVAIDDANSQVYVAATVADGNIGVEKYSLTMVDTTPAPGAFFFGTSFSGAERVEANSIAVDSGGNVIVAGGVNSLTAGIDHWMMKLSSTGTQSWLVSPIPPGDNADTWFRGVAVDGSNRYFGAGDLTTGGSLEVFTMRVLNGGGADWNDSLANAAQVDLGNAVAVDLSAPANDVVVAGFQTVAGQGKNGVIQKYTNAGGGIAPFPVTYNGPSNGDDEILDLAIDAAGGAIYAVGYETVTGQGTNMWVRRYSPAGTVVWTRTHHHAGNGDPGNDRAVSVAIDGPHVVVVGDVTLPGGGKEIHVRRYVK